MQTSRMWVFVCVLASLLLGGCKKKSACEKRCERYAKCDEATPGCADLCKQLSAEAQATMARCDEAARGDCEAFLTCTGAVKKGMDAAEPVPAPGPGPAPGQPAAADAGATD